MTLHPSLEGARVKLDRAVQHRRTLQNEIGEFIETGPYDFPVEFDVDAGWYVAHARVVEDPTPRLSVLVGEIAYECFSTLNHIAWELAARKLGRHRVYQFKREIEFPISKNPSDFASRALVGKARISKAAIAVFEELQPYNGRYGLKGTDRHPLVLMKDIADADKHRTLATAYGEIGVSELHWSWDSSRAAGPIVENRLRPGQTLEDGAEIGAIRFTSGNAHAHAYVDGDPSVEVLFNTDNWSIRAQAMDNIVAATARCFTRLRDLFQVS